MNFRFTGSVFGTILLTSIAAVGCGIFEHKINNKQKIDDVEADLQKKNDEQDKASDAQAKKADADNKALGASLQSTKGELALANQKQDEAAVAALKVQAEKNHNFNLAFDKVTADLHDKDIAISDLQIESLLTLGDIATLDNNLKNLSTSVNTRFSEAKVALDAKFEETKAAYTQQIADAKAAAKLQFDEVKGSVSTLKTTVEKEQARLTQAQTDLKKEINDGDTALKGSIEEAKRLSNEALESRVQELKLLSAKLSEKQAQFQARLSTLTDIALPQPIATSIDSSKTVSISRIDSVLEGAKKNISADITSLPAYVAIQEVKSNIAAIDSKAPNASLMLRQQWDAFGMQAAILNIQAMSLFANDLLAMDAVGKVIVNDGAIEIFKVPGSDVSVHVKGRGENAEASLVGGNAWSEDNTPVTTISLGKAYTVKGKDGTSVTFKVSPSTNKSSEGSFEVTSLN